jgi:hypothetical protein
MIGRLQYESDLRAPEDLPEEGGWDSCPGQILGDRIADDTIFFSPVRLGIVAAVPRRHSIHA